MTKIKLIIPADFEKEITGLDIINKVELLEQGSEFQLNPLELLNPNNEVVMAILSLIAIPSSIEGIIAFIKRLKEYFKRNNNEKNIVIQTSTHRYILSKTTTNEIYQELEDVLEKMVNDGKLEREI